MQLASPSIQDFRRSARKVFSKRPKRTPCVKPGRIGNHLKALPCDRCDNASGLWPLRDKLSSRIIPAAEQSAPCFIDLRDVTQIDDQILSVRSRRSSFPGMFKFASRAVRDSSRQLETERCHSIVHVESEIVVCGRRLHAFQKAASMPTDFRDNSLITIIAADQ